MNQKGNISLSIMVIIILALAATVAFGFYYYWPRETGESDINVNANINSNINADLIVNTNISPADTNATVELTGSETTSIDDTWNLYTNHDFGFYLNIPKSAWFYSGSCYYNTDDGDHSYRPRNAEVPVAAFENDSSVYINQEYYYDLAGETEEDSRSYYSECNRVDNALAELGSEKRTWHFITANVTNDTELGDFINENYGTGGCSLGDQTASELQEGVFDVAIQTDGLDPGESECWINYATVIKYYPAGNKVVAWDLGQDYGFWSIDSLEYIHDVNYYFYDTDMKNSFRFIE